MEEAFTLTLVLITHDQSEFLPLTLQCYLGLMKLSHYVISFPLMSIYLCTQKKKHFHTILVENSKI